MILGIQRRKFTDWGNRRFGVGVVNLEELLDVIDCVISSIKEISGRCRSFDKVIGSSVLNLLLGIFHLEVYRLWV